VVLPLVEMPKQKFWVFYSNIPPVYTPFFAPFFTQNKTQFEPEVREGFIRELIEFIKAFFDGICVGASFSEGDECNFGKFAIEVRFHYHRFLANPATQKKANFSFVKK